MSLYIILWIQGLQSENNEGSSILWSLYMKVKSAK